MSLSSEFLALKKELSENWGRILWFTNQTRLLKPFLCFSEFYDHY
jgi:hypothetical protein